MKLSAPMRRRRRVPLPARQRAPPCDGVRHLIWLFGATVGEFELRLRQRSRPERIRLLGKLLREARDTDVWRFTTPRVIVEERHDLGCHLGRRRAFWEYLLASWRAQGLLDEE